MHGIWKAHDAALAELVDEVKGLIRKHRLRVEFEWLPRTANAMADAVGRYARDIGKTVEFANDPCTWLL